MSNDEPTSLQDVARAALVKHEGVSGRQLDAIAKKKGLKIVYTTINHMAAGTYKSRPGRPTLEALAELSGYPLEQVYRAAQVPLPLKPLRDDLPDDADLLDGPQRRAVIDVIRLFAQQNKSLATGRAEQEGGEGNAGSTPSTSTGASASLKAIVDRVADQHVRDHGGDLVAAINDPEFTMSALGDTPLQPIYQAALLELRRREDERRSELPSPPRPARRRRADFAKAARTGEPSLKKEREAHDRATETPPEDPTGMEPI